MYLPDSITEKKELEKLLNKVIVVSKCIYQDAIADFEEGVEFRLVQMNGLINDVNALLIDGELNERN